MHWNTLTILNPSTLWDCDIWKEQRNAFSVLLSKCYICYNQRSVQDVIVFSHNLLSSQHNEALYTEISRSFFKLEQFTGPNPRNWHFPSRERYVFNVIILTITTTSNSTWLTSGNDRYIWGHDYQILARQRVKSSRGQPRMLNYPAVSIISTIAPKRLSS